MTYDELIKRFEEKKDVDFANFQRKLLCTDKNVIGVRTPDMRKIACDLKGKYDEIKHFSDEYYETTFVKLCLASKLPYDEFLNEFEFLLEKTDSWALTDTFIPICLKNKTEDFIPHIYSLINDEKEFFQRYALVLLLKFYIKKEYLPLVFDCVLKADNDKYYVHMASAWVVAEVIIKYYEEGKNFLLLKELDKKTRNKAIQKARESFRLTDNQKEELRNIKIN